MLKDTLNEHLKSPCALPQTPFIIAKDDSWKKARKARLE